MSDPVIERQAHEVRRFNRFYTARIGVLSEGLHDRPFSLTEARVVYELAQHETTTAAEINVTLRLDPGYLSRILAKLRKNRLLDRRPSPHDGRQSLIWLTDAGRSEFDILNASSQSEICEMLTSLEADERRKLIESMQTIRKLLGDETTRGAPYILRQHEPGDMGWIVHRHGVLYAAEYRWTIEFEALVAEIVADFMKSYDPAWDRCWIAEMDGENVGCILLTRATDSVAKLRLLLVEPKARGLGIGSRLVDEAVRFARRIGYEKAVLWTQSNLADARRIYERAGFRCTKEEPHHSFGHDLVAETWELEL